MTIIQNQISTDIMTIRTFCERFQFMSEGSFRWRLFQDAKFRKQCTRKLGRRVYVLPQAVISYIENPDRGEKNENNLL